MHKCNNCFFNTWRGTPHTDKWRHKYKYKIQNAQIHKLFFSSPGEELGILAGEDATIRPVQLAGDSFHLQGTDQRDYHKWMIFRDIFWKMIESQYWLRKQVWKISYFSPDFYQTLLHQEFCLGVFVGLNINLLSKNGKQGICTFLGLVLLVQVVVQLRQALGVVSPHAVRFQYLCKCEIWGC